MSYTKFGQFFKKKSFYTAAEIADLLGYHPITVTRWLKRGRLLATKASGRWLVSLRDLERFIDKFSNKKEYNAYHDKFY